MTQVNLNFILHGESKNCYKYFELDARGAILKTTDATVGVIYVKKDVFDGKPGKKLLSASLTFTSS